MNIIAEMLTLNTRRNLVSNKKLRSLNITDDEMLTFKAKIPITKQETQNQEASGFSEQISVTKHIIFQRSIVKRSVRRPKELSIHIIYHNRFKESGL